MFTYLSQEAAHHEFLIWSSVFVVLALIGFFTAFIFLHRACIIQDTPTSKVRSAAQGFVEFEGLSKAMSRSKLSAP